MLEFYLKYNKKGIKSAIADLIDEFDLIFSLEGISPLGGGKEVFPEIKPQISPDLYSKVNTYYQTIERYKSRIPFLNNYVNKSRSPKNTENSFIDLFAGSGGLSLGLENSGLKPVFVNEIEPTFAESYYFNHDLHIDNYYVGDINTLIDEINNYSAILKNIKIVCGGPPCQGFSMANRQRLIDDPRNKLYKAFLKFLHIVRPDFFIMENVKGMASKINEILFDFSSYLGKDYNFDFALLNAKDYGIPQNRERFFMIGNRLGINTKLIFEDIKKQAQGRFVLKDALNGLPELKPKPVKNNNDQNNKEFGYKLIKQNIPETAYSSFINNGKGISYLLNHKNRYNNARDIEIFRRLPQGANSLHGSIKDIMPYSNRNHIFKDKYYKLNENEISKTITSHMKFDCNMYIHPTEARGISPREAARIQTFPDSYFFRGSQNKWYAQIGNAVPVKLAEIIGNSIVKYL